VTARAASGPPRAGPPPPTPRAPPPPAEVMGTADFQAMKSELQRSHMHMQSADGADDYRNGSAYKNMHSKFFHAIKNQARTDRAQSTHAAGMNKARALGTSVQNALREDL